MRKNAKASGGGAGCTEGSGTGGDGLAAASTGAVGDDSALVAEIEEDAKTLAADSSPEGSCSDSRSHTESGETKSKPSAVQIGPKRRQLGLFWDLGHGLLADLPGGVGNYCSTGVSAFNDLTSLLSYDSRDQRRCQRETLRRLRHADLLTLSMSQTEYMEYSECRQASFTYKKARKFREWLVGGTSRPGSLALSTLAGGNARDLARLNDDTLEILGFLAYEIVQKLTEVSLAVKYDRERTAATASSSNTSNTNTPSLGDIFTTTNKTSPTTTTTSTSTAGTNTTASKTPIQVQHVEEAYRRLISGNLDADNLFRHSLNYKRKFIL